MSYQTHLLELIEFANGIVRRAGIMHGIYLKEKEKRQKNMINPKDYEIEDKIMRCDNLLNHAGIPVVKNRPSYYKDPDPYKIADIYDLSYPAFHAVKYILRAGHKSTNTYQQDINNAIDALRRDLEEYENNSKNTI